MTLIDPTTVDRHVLANGLRVLIRRDTTAPVAAIVTYVDAGYFDETDDVAGIAHVLEHMYFKGTPTRGVGEIARQTKAVGGYLNAATIYDHTLYYAVVPSSGFVPALAVQADAYRNSLIDAEELARELEVIIQEAKRKADNPSAVAIETLYELLHDRHRIRRWRIGREEGLRRLTRDHLMAFYRNFYRPSSTVLVVVGDVSTDAALAEIERMYGDIPAGKPDRAPGPGENGKTGFRYRELSGDVAQTQLSVGWRTPGTLHPDTPALDMVATALSAGRASRLFRAVRERSLASSVSAFHYTPRDIGVFTIHAETQPDRAGEALDAAWDQLRQVRNDGVGTFELERMRRITESRWMRRLENMEGQANYLAEWESLGDWELGERYYERLMTATADDIVRVANEYLPEDQAGVLVYRPERGPAVARDARAMHDRLTAVPPHALEESPRVARPSSADASTPLAEGVRAGVHVYRLESGIPVLVKVRPDAPITYAGVLALGGANRESDELAGRTLLMARLAVKGTHSRTAVQIAESGELLGGSIGPVVGGDSVGWSISVPTPHTAAAIELLADVAQHPTFADAALDTERAIAHAELAALRDDMYRYPMRLATQAAFAGHPYGVSMIGTEASLNAQTRDGLSQWHAQRFLTAPTVIVVVGAGDPDVLAGLVARHFTDLRFTPPDPLPTPSWPARVIQTVENRDKAQTAMVLAWPGPARADDARFDVAMLSGIASGLGGRLFEELRDRQSLCYTVHAFGSEMLAAGMFSAYIATSPDKESRARDGLLAELRKLREEPVAADELRRAQMYAIGSHAIRQQSGGAALAEIAGAWMFGALEELEEFERRVTAVTPESIRATAERFLDPERRVEGIVRGAGKAV